MGQGKQGGTFNVEDKRGWIFRIIVKADGQKHLEFFAMDFMVDLEFRLNLSMLILRMKPFIQRKVETYQAKIEKIHIGVNSIHRPQSNIDLKSCKT